MADRFIFSRIQHLPLFAQLPDEQLEIVSDVFQAVRYEQGMFVFRQGQASQGLMLIASGRGVFIRVNAQGIEEQIGQINPGEYINEGALFAEIYESASLRVVETMIVLLLSRGRFAQMLTQEPALRTNLRIPPQYGGQPPVMSAPPQQESVQAAPVNPPSRFSGMPPRMPTPGAAPKVSTQTMQATAPTPASPPPAAPISPPRTAPKRLFKGQRDDEAILHLFRRHWWAFGRYTVIGVLIAVMFAVVAVGAALTSTLLAVALLGAGLVAGGVVIAYLYFEWRDDFVAITDQRVVRVWNHFIQMENTISEIPLDRVLEVNVEIPPRDPIARLFNYGTVLIKTAGQTGNIALDMMPNPTQIQATIFSQRDQFKRSREVQHQAQIRADVAHALGGAVPNVPSAAQHNPTLDNLSGENLRQDRGVFFARTRFVNDDGDLVYRKHSTIWFGHIFIPLMGVLAGLAVMLGSVVITDWLLRGTVGLLIGALVMGFFGVLLYLADWDWRNDMFILSKGTVKLIRKRPFWLQNEVDTIRLNQVENVVSDVNGLLNSLLNRGVVRMFLLGADPNQVKILGPLFDPQELQSELSRRQQATKTESQRSEEASRRQQFAEYIAAYHQLQGGAPQTPPTAPPTQSAPPSAPPSTVRRDGIRPPTVPRTRRDQDLE